MRHDLIGRVALAKTLTRSGFGQLSPGTAYVNSGLTVEASASGGNPDLKPFTGKNLDAALTGMLGATVLRHDFDGDIMYKAAPEVFQGITFNTTRPYNTDKGGAAGGIWTHKDGKQVGVTLAGAGTFSGVVAPVGYQRQRLCRHLTAQSVDWVSIRGARTGD